MDRIAVIIPCYNEAKTIKKVVSDFKKELPEAKIYVYDNNSTDGTDMIAKEAGAIVKYEYRQGKGNVVRSMFNDINASCYLIVDGDDTYSASSAKEMCNYILEGKADMVIGDRNKTYFKENKRKFHGFGNKLVKILINFLFKSNINDIMTGYRAFSYEFVKNIPILSKGFEIETEMTIHALDKNFVIKEISIDYKDRIEGSISKLHTYKDGMKVLHTIFKLFREYRPMFFFNMISSIFILVAIIFSVPIFIDYINTGLVPRFPTLMIILLFIGIAFMFFLCGLVLDVIVKKHRQLYELMRMKK